MNKTLLISSLLVSFINAELIVKDVSETAVFDIYQKHGCDSETAGKISFDMNESITENHRIVTVSKNSDTKITVSSKKDVYSWSIDGKEHTEVVEGVWTINKGSILFNPNKQSFYNPTEIKYIIDDNGACSNGNTGSINLNLFSLNHYADLELPAGAMDDTYQYIIDNDSSLFPVLENDINVNNAKTLVLVPTYYDTKYRECRPTNQFGEELVLTDGIGSLAEISETNEVNKTFSQDPLNTETKFIYQSGSWSVTNDMEIKFSPSINELTEDTYQYKTKFHSCIAYGLIDKANHLGEVAVLNIIGTVIKDQKIHLNEHSKNDVTINPLTLLSYDLAAHQEVVRENIKFDNNNKLKYVPGEGTWSISQNNELTFSPSINFDSTLLNVTPINITSTVLTNMIVTKPAKIELFYPMNANDDNVSSLLNTNYSFSPTLNDVGDISNRSLSLLSLPDYISKYNITSIDDVTDLEKSFTEKSKNQLKSDKYEFRIVDNKVFLFVDKEVDLSTELPPRIAYEIEDSKYHSSAAVITSNWDTITLTGHLFNDNKINAVFDSSDTVLPSILVRAIMLNDAGEETEIEVTTNTDSLGKYSLDLFKGQSYIIKTIIEQKEYSSKVTYADTINDLVKDFSIDYKTKFTLFIKDDLNHDGSISRNDLDVTRQVSNLRITDLNTSNLITLTNNELFFNHTHNLKIIFSFKEKEYSIDPVSFDIRSKTISILVDTTKEEIPEDTSTDTGGSSVQDASTEEFVKSDSVGINLISIIFFVFGFLLIRRYRKIA